MVASFHHIKPLSVKSGEQVFLCTCCDAYQSYCCVESTALSLLYNSELQVPDLLRLKQLKDREKAELANPFTAKRIRDEKKKKEKGKAKAAPMWKPHIPVFSSCAPGSAADMATQKGKLKTRTALSAPAPVPTPADASLAHTPGHSETLYPTPEDPTLDPNPVDPKTVDPKPVDPKLLVGSRGRGPAARRSIPAKVDKPGRKVRCSIYSDRWRITDSFHIPFLPSGQASSSQPLEFEVVGGKRASRGRSASQPEPFKRTKKAKDT